MRDTIDYDGNLGGIDFSTTFAWEGDHWEVDEVRVARLNVVTKQIRWETISFNDWTYNGSPLSEKLYELHESQLDEAAAETEDEETDDE